MGQASRPAVPRPDRRAHGRISYDRLFDLRIGCGRKHVVLEVVQQRPLLLRFGARRKPLRIAGECIPLLLAVGEALPFEQVVQDMVRRPDQDRPETHLADAVLLPDLESDVGKTIVEIAETARHAVVNTQFVDHGSSLWMLFEHAPRRQGHRAQAHAPKYPRRRYRGQTSGIIFQTSGLRERSVRDLGRS